MNKFTPKILIGAVVLFLIVSAGIAFYNKNSSKTSSPYSSDPPTLAASAENSAGLGEYYDGTAGATANTSPSPIPSPQSINVYVYPGSENTSSSSAKLELSSNDNPTKITDWYKNKIKELQFNAQSLASSNTNGEIFNKLSAAKPGEKIEVTIKKDQSGSNVSITVDRL